jgi:hypothetical protein
LKQLSEQQQEELIEKLTYCDEKMLKGFHRLFFVMQGILNVNYIYTDWVDVEEREPLNPHCLTEKMNKRLAEWFMSEGDEISMEEI